MTGHGEAEVLKSEAFLRVFAGPSRGGRKRVFEAVAVLELLLTEEVSDFRGWILAKKAPPF
jgi:hypothetical protein